MLLCKEMPSSAILQNVIALGAPHKFVVHSANITISLGECGECKMEMVL